MAIRSAPRSFGRINPVLPVDVIQMLRFRVIRLSVLITARRGGWDTAIVPAFAEILLAKSQQCRPINLGIPANVILNAWVKRLPVLVIPRLLGLVLRFEKNRAGLPIILFSGQVSAPLQKQNAFARGSKMIGERSTTSSSADDDDVKMILLRHLHPHFLPFPSSLSHLNQVVAAFPGVARRPEKGESNWRFLPGSDRNI